jgi:nucleoside-diphosphate-sugar epimerase
MLVASRDAKVKRFVYAASSSTYGEKRYQKWKTWLESPFRLMPLRNMNELYGYI